MSDFMSHILVPIAIGAVAIVLLLGLVNMMRGGSPHLSQRLMRLGVLMQFIAVIGVARLHASGNPELAPVLARIQNDLFDVGADLCLPDKGKGPGGARLDVTDAQLEWIQRQNAP